MSNAYFQQNPDVAEAYAQGMFGDISPDAAAAQHYYNYGASEGRSAPSSTPSYMAANPDVAAAFGRGDFGNSANLAAERHYYAYGRDEGRDAPSTVLDYMESNPDVAKAYAQGQFGGMSPLEAAQFHYSNYGRFEGRQSPFSDPGLQEQYRALEESIKGQAGMPGNLLDLLRGMEGGTKGFAEMFSDLQEQMAQLQAAYQALIEGQTKKGGGGGSGDDAIVGGIVVDGEGVGTGGQTPGITGPTGPGIMPGPNTGNSMFLMPVENTGSANPGGVISGASQQLFDLGPPRIAIPQIPVNPYQYPQP